MTDSARSVLFALFIALWLSALAVRLVPQLRQRFARFLPYAYALSWLAILGLLAVSFLG